MSAARELAESIVSDVRQYIRLGMSTIAMHERVMALLEAEGHARVQITEGWRPIEEAPRDGTEFLALVATNGKRRCVAGKFNKNGLFISVPGFYKYIATHWQPLPAPPEGV